jgi:hypothetical protein
MIMSHLKFRKMKTVLFILSFLLANVGHTMAGKYENSMKAAIKKLNEATNMDTHHDVAATFERIGEAEKTLWLPYYYSGLAYIWSSHLSTDMAVIDGELDKAQKMVEKAGELSSDNDEIVTLQGYIYMMRVAVDPATRGMQYSSMAMEELGRAVSINRENPRATMILGRMQLGMYQFMGMDTSESCGIIERANMLFKNHKPASELDPVWGSRDAAAFLEECGIN